MGTGFDMKIKVIILGVPIIRIFNSTVIDFTNWLCLLT